MGNNGRFLKGHIKLGGFSKSSKHNTKAKDKISESLKGKYGCKARRWLGDKASYSAKHMWILKHFGKASLCEFNPNHNTKRYEWANRYHMESRDIGDYIQLCPSCHRKFDSSRYCPHGHEYTKETTILNCRGHRLCKICLEVRKNDRQKLQV